MPQKKSLKLSAEFYQRDTITVARELLGMRLVRVHQGQRLSGWITEVEAYLGVKDRACHTFGGKRTPRTETMFRAGGCVYVYLIYGMYHCLNFVTRKEGEPEAVLIRSILPEEGISIMERLRGRKLGGGAQRGLSDGPGKLAQALALTREHDGCSLISRELFVEQVFGASVPEKIQRTRIMKGPRIGVDYAGSHARWPLRFWLAEK